jgi:hypothetical protein
MTVEQFLDWIAAIAEGRAADVEPAAIKVTFKVRIRASQPMPGRASSRTGVAPGGSGNRTD